MPTRTKSHLSGDQGQATALSELLRTGSAVSGLTGFGDHGWDVHLLLPDVGQALWRSKTLPVRWQVGGHATHVQVKANADARSRLKLTRAKLRSYTTSATPTFLLHIRDHRTWVSTPWDLDDALGDPFAGAPGDKRHVPATRPFDPGNFLVCAGLRQIVGPGGGGPDPRHVAQPATLVAEFLETAWVAEGTAVLGDDLPDAVDTGIGRLTRDMDDWPGTF